LSFERIAIAVAVQFQFRKTNPDFPANWARSNSLAPGQEKTSAPSMTATSSRRRSVENKGSWSTARGRSCLHDGAGASVMLKARGFN
jgi:hypothetical protein